MCEHRKWKMLPEPVEGGNEIGPSSELKVLIVPVVLKVPVNNNAKSHNNFILRLLAD